MAHFDPPAPLGDASSDARFARRAAAGALAAELGHDLQGPLNLFRSMTERLERGQPLDAEDAALLREELERLSRLSARLRELARHQLTRSEHTPGDLLARALALSPPVRADAAGLELELEGSASVTIRCDASLVARALREVIDNALEARRARAGARFEAGAIPAWCIWDDGDGFVQEPGQAARFGVTTRPAAAGLGLTLALRAARAHGCSIHFERTDGLTRVRWSFAGAEGAR